MAEIALLIAATALLVAIPGPNVALIVATSLRHGPLAGAATVAGTTFGVGLQMLLVVLGLHALLSLAAEAFLWLRWAGVAYLLWLGIAAWRTPTAPQPIEAVSHPYGRSLLRGGLLALVNPKTLLFNAAFLPQFAGGPEGPGLALLAGVYLAVLFFGDLCWALAAHGAGRILRRYGTLRNRLTGACLMGAALGLALYRRPA